jgi:hypothetical protein
MLADSDAVVTAMECDDGALPVMADAGARRRRHHAED